MKINRYLIIGSKRFDNWSKKRRPPTTRLTTKPPKLSSHEVAVKLSLEVPDAFFEKPLLSARIEIPEDAVSAPVIEADVVDNIQEIVNRELGIDLNISLLNVTNEAENGI